MEGLPEGFLTNQRDIVRQSQDAITQRLAEAGCGPLKSLHNPLPRFTPVPIRHIDQTGDPADQRIFISGKQVVGVGYLPQHLDNANTFCLGEVLDHDPGEVE